jgi:hypothetical protein
MYQAGVMAPPNLYELPPHPGLMERNPQAESLELSLRGILWSLTIVVGTLELLLEALGP